MMGLEPAAREEGRSERQSGRTEVGEAQRRQHV
jgi:hypothetical protein